MQILFMHLLHPKIAFIINSDLQVLYCFPSMTSVELLLYSLTVETYVLLILLIYIFISYESYIVILMEFLEHKNFEKVLFLGILCHCQNLRAIKKYILYQMKRDK